MNQYGIGTGLRIGLGAFQRLLLTPTGNQGFGASDDHEIGHRLCRFGSLNLPAMFIDGDQLPADAGVKTAPLGIDVILNADRSNTRSLTIVDGAHDVQGIAVPGVAIRNNGDGHRFRNVAFHLELLTRCDETRVGNALQRGRNGEPTGPHAVEAGPLDQPGAERVMSPDDLQGSRLFQGCS